jgi:cyclase
MKQISKGVYFENGFRGCNASFVVTDEGLVAIDTPMSPEDAKKWLTEMAKYGPVRYLVNTEPHPDHAAGNYWFNCIVVGHEGTRQALLNADLEELKKMLNGMAPGGISLNKEYFYRPPSITFSQSMTLHLGKHSFHLISMPGHTASQTAVYIPEEKVVFTGDNVVQRMPIFLNSLPYEWLKSIKRLKQLDVDIIVPGHGDICDKTYLQNMNDAVQYCLDSVKSAIDAGMSFEEILERVTFADRYPMQPKNKQGDDIRHGTIKCLYETLIKR